MIVTQGVEAIRVMISDATRGLTPKLIADLRRRSAIDTEIGHMKTDGRLPRLRQSYFISSILYSHFESSLVLELKD